MSMGVAPLSSFLVVSRCKVEACPTISFLAQGIEEESNLMEGKRH
jgi:hypothetical protein